MKGLTWVTWEQSRAAAAIDQDLLPKRILLDGNQFGDLDPVTHLERGVEQGAQPHVLRFQSLEFLQAGLQFEIFGMQVFILSEDITAAAECLAGLPAQDLGQAGQILNRIEHHRQARAHRFQMVLPVIEYHQQDG